MPYLDRNANSGAIICDLCGDARWGDPFTDDNALDTRLADSSGHWIWEPSGYPSCSKCSECNGLLYPSWVLTHHAGDGERIRYEWMQRIAGMARIRKVMASWLDGDLYKWEAYALIRETMDDNECLTLLDVSWVTDISTEVLHTRLTELEAMREFLNYERMANNAARVMA